jgi:hypothetical protein
MPILVKDRLRGLNLLDDPNKLLPGEAVQAVDVYITGKNLKKRPYRRMLQEWANQGDWGNIVSAYWADNTPNRTIIFEEEATGKVYFTECVITTNAISYTDPELASASVTLDSTSPKYLPYENTVIIIGTDKVYQFDPSRGFQDKLIDVTSYIRPSFGQTPLKQMGHVAPTLIQAQTVVGGIRRGFYDYYVTYKRSDNNDQSERLEYGIEYTAEQDGIILTIGDPVITLWDTIQLWVKEPTSPSYFLVVEIPVTFGIGGTLVGDSGLPPQAVLYTDVSAPIDQTGDYDYIFVYQDAVGRFSSVLEYTTTKSEESRPYYLTFYIGPTSQANLLDKLSIYRRDVAAGESEYFLVTEDGDIGNPIEFRDTINTDQKDPDVTYDVGIVNIDVSDVTFVVWHQNRAIWAKSDGSISVSKRNNPFTIPGALNQVNVTTSTFASINGMTTYYGTLIVFTEEGIYHIVGSFADEAEDNDYQVYHAVKDLHCVYSKRILTIENKIYFLSVDGLNIYDARKVTNVSEKISSLFARTKDMVLEWDQLRKLILVRTPFQVLVYYYPDQILEQEIYGDWTQWLISTPDLISGFVPQSFSNTTEAQYRIPITITSKEFWQFTDSSTGAPVKDNSIICIWRSQEFDGGTIGRYKKWEELRFQIDSTHPLDLQFNIDGNTRNVALVDFTKGKAGIHRERIKSRGQLFQFRIQQITLISRLELSGFVITGAPLGR